MIPLWAAVFPGHSAYKTIGKDVLWDCEQPLQQAHLTVALWEPNQSHSSPPLLWKCSSSFFLREDAETHRIAKEKHPKLPLCFIASQPKAYGPIHCILKCFKFKGTKLRKKKVQNVNPTSTCANNWVETNVSKMNKGRNVQGWHVSISCSHRVIQHLVAAWMSPWGTQKSPGHHGTGTTWATKPAKSGMPNMG